MNIHDYRNYSNMNKGEIKQTEAFYKSLQLMYVLGDQSSLLAQT